MFYYNLGGWSLPYRLLFAALFLFTLLPNVALAHAMGVEVRLKNNQIHIEVFFHDDSPAPGSLVTIENEAGEKILSEKTPKPQNPKTPTSIKWNFKFKKIKKCSRLNKWIY